MPSKKENPMFDEPLSDRVARLEEAYRAARERYESGQPRARDGLLAPRDDVNVRRLALIKVEQALLIVNF
jgi:hypothetical protein